MLPSSTIYEHEKLKKKIIYRELSFTPRHIHLHLERKECDSQDYQKSKIEEDLEEQVME